MKRKSVRIYSFTGTGSRLALNLAEKLKQEGYVCTGYTVARFAEDKRLQRLNDGWKQEIGASWGEHALVFIGAAGIAIRAIAPFVKDKFTDPPVIVLDEKGTFAIPLLSGHVGGGVTLAKVLAEYTGGRAVITTATDVQKKFAADVFAMENGLVITDREEAKKISAGILEKKNTGIFSEFPLLGDVPEELTICGSEEQLEGCCGKIVICERNPRNKKSGVLYLLPRNLYVGMGCKKGTKKEILEAELLKTLEKHGFLPEQIRALGSIDLKREEAGLLELADSLGVEFLTYSAESLQEISAVSSSSEFVRGVTGVDNVCERAAKKMCPDGVMVQEKVCLNQCTAAFVCGEVMVKFRKEEEES